MRKVKEGGSVWRKGKGGGSHYSESKFKHLNIVQNFV